VFETINDPELDRSQGAEEKRQRSEAAYFTLPAKPGLRLDREPRGATANVGKKAKRADANPTRVPSTSKDDFSRVNAEDRFARARDSAQEVLQWRRPKRSAKERGLKQERKKDADFSPG